MSETEIGIKDVPPVGELLAGDHGLTAWRPQYDGIEISRVPFDRVRLRSFRAAAEVSTDMSADDARHLAKLLTEAAERCGPKKGVR